MRTRPRSGNIELPHVRAVRFRPSGQCGSCLEAAVGEEESWLVLPQAMSDEWFRSPSWREEDRELFAAKLARAQKRNRAQYMRIKALSLAECGDKTAHAAAGELFERIFGEYPGDELQVTMAHADKARWHRQRGEQDQAVEHYRRAVALVGHIDTDRGTIREVKRLAAGR